jgi:hypothetical protein
MGPLNEYARRFLDVTQQHRALLQANAGGPPPEYFGYVAQLGSATNTLTNGVSFQTAISIQADAWFLWEYLSVGVTMPATPPFGGPEQFTEGGNLLLQITNTGTGDDLYSIPSGFAGMPATLSAGSPNAGGAGIPYIFPTPVLLPPNTNVNILVQKLGTNAGADNPDLTGAWVMLNGSRVQVWN